VTPHVARGNGRDVCGRQVLRTRKFTYLARTRKGNLVARLRGTRARTPILLLAHLESSGQP